MFDILHLNFDADGDGVLDSTAQGADLDGDGVMDAMFVDLDNDGTVDFVAMDCDNDGEPETIVAEMDIDQNGETDTLLLLTDTDGDREPDAFEIFDLDEDAEVSEALNAEEPASEETDLEHDLAEIEGRLNRGVQRSSIGASEGTCRASHTNQNYCVLNGF